MHNDLPKKNHLKNPFIGYQRFKISKMCRNQIHSMLFFFPLNFVPDHVVRSARVLCAAYSRNK